MIATGHVATGAGANAIVLSFLNAFRRVASEAIEPCLVTEDDAEFPRDFRARPSGNRNASNMRQESTTRCKRDRTFVASRSVGRPGGGASRSRPRRRAGARLAALGANSPADADVLWLWSSTFIENRQKLGIPEPPGGHGIGAVYTGKWPRYAAASGDWLNAPVLTCQPGICLCGPKPGWVTKAGRVEMPSPLTIHVVAAAAPRPALGSSTSSAPRPALGSSASWPRRRRDPPISESSRRSEGRGPARGGDRTTHLVGRLEAIRRFDPEIGHAER